MPKFVTNEVEDEDVLFATFGKLKPNQDAEKSVLIKEGEAIEGVLTEIKKSTKEYKKIYVLKVKGQDKPVLITGKTDLIKGMGHDPTTKAKLVAEVNDIVRIQFDGISKTGKGHNYYNFTVGIAKSA